MDFSSLGLSYKKILNSYFCMLTIVFCCCLYIYILYISLRFPEENALLGVFCFFFFFPERIGFVFLLCLCKWICSVQSHTDVNTGGKFRLPRGPSSACFFSRNLSSVLEWNCFSSNFCFSLNVLWSIQSSWDIFAKCLAWNFHGNIYNIL